MRKLAQEFRAAAQNHRAAFPKRLKNFIVSTTDDGTVYESEGMRRFRRRKTGKFNKQAQKIEKAMAERPTTAIVDHSRRDGEMLNYMKLKTDERLYVFIDGERAQYLSLMWAFNHEMGHIVAPQGTSFKIHRAECTADAYALLRHIQCFGLTEAEAEDVLHLGTNFMMSGNAPINYSTTVLEKIISLHRSGAVDIENLSLQETAKLAGKIAKRYSLPEKTIYKIDKAYTSVRAIEDNGTTQAHEKQLKEIIRVMHKNRRDQDIYRLGKRYLNSENGRIWLDHFRKNDPAMGNLLEEMDRHEKRTGFILNGATAVDAKKKAGTQAGLKH